MDTPHDAVDAHPDHPAQEPHEPADAIDRVIRPFLREGRLVRLPAKFSRQRAVLLHLAVRHFEPGVRYPEAAVNDVLRAWCEGGATDHVAVRRALIDHGVLTRGDGYYWRSAAQTYGLS